MNSSPSAFSEHGAVGARRLGDRVALHVRRPRAAVRVVLERVEVARLGAEAERDLRHLAGRVRVVRRELAALLGLGVAAAAGGEHDGAGVDEVLADTRAPAAVRPPPSSLQRRVREARAGARLPGLAQALRDRVAGAVADLEQPLARSRRRSGRGGSRRCSRVNSTPSSSSQWIARGASPVSTSTSRRSAVSCEERQTSSACCSGESSSPNAAWMPPCAFDGVVRLQRALGRERDARAGALGGDGGGEAGGAAADHEHVEEWTAASTATTHT